MASRLGKKRTASKKDDSLEKESPRLHAKQNPRISKQDFFATSALWMERCPLGGDPDPIPKKVGDFGVEKAGAVFVGVNDRILAMDCSRNGIHAAARILINFPDKVKGCTVYMSRKPCSFCVKLLVQGEVLRILFLPFEPEASPDPECTALDNAIRIEHILKVFPVGMSIFKPEISESMQNTLASTVKRPDGRTFEWEPFKKQLSDTYWSDMWVGYLTKIAGQLEISTGNLEHEETSSKKEKLVPDIIRCPGLDSSFVEELQVSIGNLMGWTALATVAPIPDIARSGPYEFKRMEAEDPNAENEGDKEQGPGYKEFKQPFLEQTEEDSSVENKEGGDGEQGRGYKVQKIGVPNPSCPNWQSLARHMSRMALIAARRTDDPSTGVGMILLVNNEVVSVGLNGYPSKAHVGDFPRSKDSKTHGTSLKYPYLIHAEQNALLLRNTRDIKNESATAFVTKTPCDDCVNLLVESGVHNVVLPWKEPDKSKPGIKYTAFLRKIKDANFRAFYGEVVCSPGLTKRKILAKL